MRHRGITKTLLSMGAVLAVLALPAPLEARQDSEDAGRPDLPIPRLPDGTPHLGWDDPAHKGTWQVTRGHWELADDLVDRPEEGIPFKPWARALYEYRIAEESKDDPEGLCVPPGGTRATSTNAPWEFLQMPGQERIFRVFQRPVATWQEIHMDGRDHPREAYDLPTWLGHSVGHWEGDTLVVDTVGFNEGHWMSRYGAIRTSQHHLVERFTRIDYYTMRYEATIDDPAAYTRPWTIGWDLRWNEGQELEHHMCQENNRFLRSFIDIE